MLSDLTLAADANQREGSKAYALDRADFAAINSVKSFLEKSIYKELFTVDNHIVCLEDIRKRLSFISAAEARAGLTNWSLQSQIEELRDLTERLKDIKNGLIFKLA